MAQDAETEVKDHHTQHDHIGDDEVGELQRLSCGFYLRVQQQAERFASTRLGQYVIERADRCLKLIEDTTKWSLPQEKNSNAVVLERPLPWIPFLILIVMLRMARIWLSVGALLIGNGPVSPSDVIYFIQTRRRKLRAIRLHGLKVMRHRQDDCSSSSRSGKGLTQLLSQWLSRAICRPGVQRINSGRQFNVPSKDTTESKPQNQHQNQSVSKPTREDIAIAEQNLTIDELLNKYANDNSEDDSDFVPNPEDDNDSTSSSESESSDEEQLSGEEQQQEKVVNKTKTLNNGVHKDEVEVEDETKPKTMTATATSNGSHDKEPMDVAAVKDKDWERSSTPLTLGPMNKQLYNNTAAAVSSEELPNDTFHYSDSHPDLDPHPDLDNDTPANGSNEATDKPVAPITSSEPHSQTTQLSIDTLTPATSSEDIFYSPIGSPNCFNEPLRNASIISAAHHSTPEMEEKLAAQNVLLDATPVAAPAPAPAAAPATNQPHHHHQHHHRQFSHQHQRYRGRNRR